MPRSKISIDEIIRATGHTTLTKTSVPLPSDDMSSNRNFYDRIGSSVEYHDNKERRKFKELTFSGMIIKYRNIDTYEDLIRRTSLVFANDIIQVKEQERIWELFVHIPEISGILPQPTYDQIKSYSKNLLEGFEEEYYDRLASRFPKFYCVQKQPPETLSIWKVRFHDENFLYYGKAEELKTPAGTILSSELTESLSEYQESLTEEQKNDTRDTIQSGQTINFTA